MTAVFVKAIRDLRRRRLQAAVLFVTALLAVGTGTMALTLLSQTHDPYETAFAAQKGAHLQVSFDRRTDVGAIAATPSLIGASAYAGPFSATSLQFQMGSRKFGVGAIGRDDPGGTVEQLRITNGQWPKSDGEIALTRSFADLNHISVGDSIKVISVPQEPVLTVVAKVVDIDEGSADLSGQRAWVTSSAIGRLTAEGLGYYVMEYRFAFDPNNAQLQADVDTLRRALPQGSITGSLNYLLIRSIFNITNQIVTSVLLAFSVFALLATVAIVANLVTGVVLSAYREIGIMKAVGFTPFQVEVVFVLQILMPVAAASLVAVPIGTVASQPLLANSSRALGLAYQPTFSPVLDLMALAGALVIVTAAALFPALRAGRLKPAAIIASASAPRGRSGRSLRRLAARLGLPRPIGLGFGDAFARPMRAMLTLLAVFLGVVTVSVALGVPRSFLAINNSETSAGNADVAISRSPALSDSETMQIINAQPETARVVGETQYNVVVPDIGDQVNARVFRGDSSRLGYMLVAGRWFNHGEAVAPEGLMHDAHLKLGDRFTITVLGKPVSLLLVGEVYDINNLGHALFLDLSTISSADPTVAPYYYLITLKPGSDPDGYVRRVAAVQPDLLDVGRNNTSIIAPVAIIDGVLLVVAAVIVIIGIAGIFNTMLLNTRERVRDTATLKAIGMSPRQVVVMVAASAAFVALIGGVFAVPAGVALNHVLLDFISNAAGNDTPPAAYGVFAAWELVAIPLSAVVVAVAASLIPGRWAARTNVIEVLHAE